MDSTVYANKSKKDHMKYLLLGLIEKLLEIRKYQKTYIGNTTHLQSY